MAQSTPPLSPRARRPMPAGRAILVMVIALGLGSLLNISSLREATERQPFGWRRSVGLVLVAPLDGVSAVLGLNQPRVMLDDALGRETPGTSISAASRRPADPAFASRRAEAGAPSEEPVPVAPTPTVPATPEPRTFSAADPLRVWVIGDSLTEQLAPALKDVTAATDAAVTEHEFHYSSGLSRPDFFDWPARLDELALGADPDVWVVMVGANDAQDIRSEQGYLSVGTDAWEAEYRRRVGAVSAQLTSTGQQVVWVGQPVMRSATFAGRMNYLNSIYASEAERHEGVTYIDSWTLFQGQDGGYAAYLPDGAGTATLMRLGDGVHLTRAGGDRLAAAVFGVIDERWGLSRVASAIATPASP